MLLIIFKFNSISESFTQVSMRSGSIVCLVYGYMVMDLSGSNTGNETPIRMSPGPDQGWGHYVPSRPIVYERFTLYHHLIPLRWTPVTVLRHPRSTFHQGPVDSQPVAAQVPGSPSIARWGPLALKTELWTAVQSAANIIHHHSQSASVWTWAQYRL